MTELDTGQQQCAATSPRRNRALLYGGIIATVLIVSVGVTLLIALPDGPPPVDYSVSVTGNVSASWVSDDSEGTLDLTNFGNSDTIRAGSLTLTVKSNMPSGASCSIIDLDANVIDVQMAYPARGTSGKDALVTVTCRTNKH
ncbi:hypothetical protein Amsp01_090250 [Amycolatopsis sp. NBRC 101858]|uniref:hypothetical protein n=1 Tax=Amycolatopsis sp. NBRC 101858 TaxID=3032200 RepID=UPI0024A4A3CA|nr:hypothetical protein [Amycolatopsis sp. NBRC 101858]GLY43002.1 hypothetical protein Amsp01_090250 [Amycolatopsis sp. NBRC 101858]